MNTQQEKRWRQIVEQQAKSIFNSDEEANLWLNSPLQVLSNNKPLSLLNTEDGYKKVIDTLGRIQHGVYK